MGWSLSGSALDVDWGIAGKELATMVDWLEASKGHNVTPAVVPDVEGDFRGHFEFVEVASGGWLVPEL